MGQYSAWLNERGFTHAHCSFLCESPQPQVWGGELVCGQCFHERNEISFMIGCTPETCPQDKE